MADDFTGGLSQDQDHESPLTSQGNNPGNEVGPLTPLPLSMLINILKTTSE